MVVKKLDKFGRVVGKRKGSGANSDGGDLVYCGEVTSPILHNLLSFSLVFKIGSVFL